MPTQKTGHSLGRRRFGDRRAVLVDSRTVQLMRANGIALKTRRVSFAAARRLATRVAGAETAASTGYFPP